MHKFFSSIGMLSLTFLLNSCGELNKNSNTLIKGGYNVINKDNFVYKTTVGITTVEYSEYNLTFCSGTIISKRHILTAAHCLTEDTKLPRIATTDLLVVFGTQKVESWKILGVKAQMWHTNYNPDAATETDPKTPPPNDIAVLYLSEDIPEGFESIEMNFDKVKVGEKVILAGNGTVYGTPVESTGILRYVDQTISFIDNNMYRIETGNADENNAKGACVGDSGGPLFIERDGKTMISGVLSIGTSPFGIYCTAWNAYTNIAKYKTFIDLAMSNINKGKVD